MNRGERRATARRHAVSRKKRITRKYRRNAAHESFVSNPHDIPVGYFRNNNIANKYSNGGSAPKTNSRKAHIKYRLSGSYGPAMNWSAADQRKLDALDYSDCCIDMQNDTTVEEEYDLEDDGQAEVITQ